MWRLLALSLLLPLLLAACSGPLVEDPTDPKVQIVFFEATPSDSGEGMFRLRWEVEALEDGTLTLEPGIDGQTSLDVTARTQDGFGEIDVEPETNTTYTLTATTGARTVTAKADVILEGAATIVSFAADREPVNPGVPVTLQWEVDGADSVRLEGPGLGDGVDVTGSSQYVVEPSPGADYTLVATSSVGDVQQTLTDVGRNVPAASFLIAGQSNAQGKNVSPQTAQSFITAGPGVQMLGNDYVWKDAYEPLDDCTDQVDSVSQDPSDSCTSMGNSGVSLGVSLGNEVAEATGGEVFLIPAAKGGTDTTAWEPKSDRYDRSTLFGSAAHRARLAGEEQGAPLSTTWSGDDFGAIVWYQGESDTNTKSETDSYLNRTNTIFSAFQAELDAPIIYAQLARIYEQSYEDGRNLLVQRVRDAQRQLESEGNQRYMVVTHDLEMVDRVHLAADAQVELGRRVALAFREHLLGEGVDGSGPRLLGIVKVDSITVRVDFDRPINAPETNGPDAYSGYFAAFAGDTQLTIASIERGSGSAGENTAVFITLSSPEFNSIDVRYLPPELPSESGAPMLANVVRSASCSEPMPGTSLCLPAPAFGTATGGVSLSTMQFPDID